MSGWVHGADKYRSSLYACRCSVCTTAHTSRARAEQASRRARLTVDPTLAEHGRDSTYRNWGCRCEPCSTAHSASA